MRAMLEMEPVHYCPSVSAVHQILISEETSSLFVDIVSEALAQIYLAKSSRNLVSQQKAVQRLRPVGFAAL